MPIVTDYSLARSETGTLTVSMIPPTPIGGWTLEYRLTKRFGSSDYIILGSVTSGYNGVSGITVVNSGNGIVNITNQPAFVSGKTPGNYAWQLVRTDSGMATEIAKGFRLMNY